MTELINEYRKLRNRIDNLKRVRTFRNNFKGIEPLLKLRNTFKGKNPASLSPAKLNAWIHKYYDLKLELTFKDKESFKEENRFNNLRMRFNGESWSRYDSWYPKFEDMVKSSEFDFAWEKRICEEVMLGYTYKEVEKNLAKARYYKRVLRKNPGAAGKWKWKYSYYKINTFMISSTVIKYCRRYNLPFLGNVNEAV